MSREDIARQREIARAKAQITEALWVLVYCAIALATNLFATQMMLFVVSIYGVHMGFAVGYVIILIVTMTVSVGTFIGVKFAK